MNNNNKTQTNTVTTTLTSLILDTNFGHSMCSCADKTESQNEMFIRGMK